MEDKRYDVEGTMLIGLSHCWKNRLQSHEQTFSEEQMKVIRAMYLTQPPCTVVMIRVGGYGALHIGLCSIRNNSGLTFGDLYDNLWKMVSVSTVRGGLATLSEVQSTYFLSIPVDVRERLKIKAEYEEINGKQWPGDSKDVEEVLGITHSFGRAQLIA